MDLGLFFTIVSTGAAVIGANIALIGWIRSDMRAFSTEIRGWKEEINKEMKDFHGRLCSLEEKSK